MLTAQVNGNTHGEAEDISDRQQRVNMMKSMILVQNATKDGTASLSLNYTILPNQSSVKHPSPTNKRNFYQRHQHEIDEIIGTSVGIVFGLLTILICVYFIAKCCQSRKLRNRRPPLRHQSTVMTKIADSDEDEDEAGNGDDNDEIKSRETPTRTLEKTMENLKMMGIL
ncbi:hypothetical protein FSP39_019623 [Pinctada imbricata]|uniref:Uncharacterized protein n=1 Tax=Pinctada imbricata TaxID=66713 RepID=A0AA88YLY3_PINIB|nr:hypothetical protein FSP39_019623 [Pinctada imbricata]